MDHFAGTGSMPPEAGEELRRQRHDRCGRPDPAKRPGLIVAAQAEPPKLRRGRRVGLY